MRRTRWSAALVAVSLSSSLLIAQDSPLVAAAKSSRREVFKPALQLAPELKTVRWFNSTAKSLESYRGRVVLLDFWATWCGPCVAAHPRLETLAKQFGSSSFVVVLVHDRFTFDRQHTAKIAAEEVLPQFIASHHLTLPVAVAQEREFSSFGVTGIPFYVLVDKRGYVRFSKAGTAPDEKAIRELLTE